MNILDSIPSAAEARDRAKGVQSEQVQLEATRANAAIAKAVEHGLESVVVEPPLICAAVLDTLRAKGYGVQDRHTGPMESGTEISWY